MSKVKLSRLLPVPMEQWPSSQYDPARLEVWKSDKYLVQVFQERDGQIRVSVNRVSRKGLDWRDGISWEALMQIKREIGQADAYAVEVLPPDRDIVNVANMRHFWILPHPVCGWQRDGAHHV